MTVIKNSIQNVPSVNLTGDIPRIQDRVAELLARMTLEEKVGQLSQVTPYEMSVPDEFGTLLKETLDAEDAPALPERAGLRDDLRAGRVGALLNLSDPAKINEYQRVAVQESRLGIPLLIGADVIHGLRTVFPIPLAESCTWNPDLLERAAKVAATEASAVGINWVFAPMLDISRDPRWGRIAESAGEDTYLTGVLGAARVRGFQAELPTGRKIASCPKHYVGYGAVEGGRDYNTVDLSERTLRDVYLPPFQMAFQAGAGSVMTAFNELSGVPASINPFTLRRVLRDEWGWEGVTLSDYEAVKELLPHGVATDLKDAARLSMLAGLDVDMVSDAYVAHLPDLVRGGQVPEALVNEAAARVLHLKFSLGLFEQPFVDEVRAESFMLRPEARELALEVAQQSTVLLKNEGNVLPLTPGKQKIALIGPLADVQRPLLGCWTFFGEADGTDTILAGLRSEQAEVTITPGCGVEDESLTPENLTAAVEAAHAADMVVLVVGEHDDLSGEGRSRSTLGLPGCQQALADAAFATGKPVVTVVITGRPLVIPELARQSSALLVAWHGGTRAGKAVSDVLFGRVNPSGKLTAGWPQNVGQLPMTYAHKNTGRPMKGQGAAQFGEFYKSRYLDVPNTPLFPFGFGLSYTTFEYSDLHVLTPEVKENGTVQMDTVQVEFTLTNTGARAGTEVVQLYVRDVIGSVTRPVRELKAFERVELEAQEARRLTFSIPVSQLKFTRADGTYGTEPGEFNLWVGGSSVDGLEGRFHLIP